MPIFITNEEELLDIAKRASECRVKKIERKNIVKIKARTKRYLYTYVTTLDRLNELLNRLKDVCSIKEV